MTSGSPRRAPSILAALAFALLGAAPAAAAPFRLIITDLTTPLVPGSVLDLADRLGYFRRAGVEVELVRVQQTPSALAALKAGEGDMADVGTDAALVSTLAARLQALLAGRIDATTVSTGTWATLPDRANLRVVMDQAAFRAAAPVVTKVDVVPDAVLESKRDQVVAVVRAIAAASRDFAARPEAWVDAVAAVRTEVPRDTLATLAASFKDEWSVDGGLAAPELQATEDWLFSGADFAGLRKPPLAAWADLSVERDALRGLAPAPAR